MASESVVRLLRVQVERLMDGHPDASRHDYRMEALREFEAAIGAEAVAEWREAVREYVDARRSVGITVTPDERAAAMVRHEQAFGRLRALLEDSQEEEARRA